MLRCPNHCIKTLIRMETKTLVGIFDCQSFAGFVREEEINSLILITFCSLSSIIVAVEFSARDSIE